MTWAHRHDSSDQWRQPPDETASLTFAPPPPQRASARSSVLIELASFGIFGIGIVIARRADYDDVLVLRILVVAAAAALIVAWLAATVRRAVRQERARRRSAMVPWAQEVGRWWDGAQWRLPTTWARAYSIPIVVALAGLIVSGAAAGATVGNAPEVSQWAGWIATNNTFSSIQGSWTEPSLVCPSAATAVASTWVGLGGHIGAGVEQVGVDATCTNGSASYRAWYETYPQPAQFLDAGTFSVSPGNVVTARVDVNGAAFAMTLTSSSGAAFHTETTAGVERDTSSAEWVVESPCRERAASTCARTPFPNFATLHFTNCKATASVAGSPATRTVDGWQTVASVAIADDGTDLATAGQPTGGAFDVIWKAG